MRVTNQARRVLIWSITNWRSRTGFFHDYRSSDKRLTVVCIRGIKCDRGRWFLVNFTRKTCEKRGEKVCSEASVLTKAVAGL